MGLLTRVARSFAGPDPAVVVGTAMARVDMTPPQVRISRPVSYLGGVGVDSGRVALDLASAVSAGFAGSALAYRCVQAIASSAAALDLVVERRTGDSLDVQPEHPVSVLWNRRPNPLTSARAFKETVWAQLELVGECLIYLDRGDTGEGEITAMYPVFDPFSVVVDQRVAGELKGFIVKPQGGARVPLLASEALWLRYPHPREPWGAMAPFEAARFALDLDGWAKAWQQGELRNGARPEGVIYLGDVDPETHDNTVEDFRSRHEGPRNANRHLFLSGTTPGAYSRIGLTPAEASYSETRSHNAEETFLAFGVPRDYLVGGTTFENRRAARVTLWSDTIVPKLELVAGEIDRQLLPDLAESCRFDTSRVDALRENEDSVFNRVRGIAFTDVTTMNEGRVMLGLERMDDPAYDLTLTPYRETMRARVLAANPPPLGEQVRRALGPTPPVLERARRARPLKPAAVHKEYDRLESIGERAVKRLAEKQKRVVLGRLERKGNTLATTFRAWHEALAAAAPATYVPGQVEVRQDIDDVFDQAYWIEFTREALGDTLVSAAYDAGSAMTGAALNVGLDVYGPEVAVQMEARALALAEQVTATTRAALDAALLEPGLAAGESIPDLAARLTSVFDALSTTRATTIARTETVGGFNAASRQVAVTSGVAVGREWLATLDDRTRESHVDLNGYQTQGMDDAYPNGLMHPGDPQGSPEETVRCRCVELFVLEEG